MFPATFRDSAGVVPRPNASILPMVLMIACITPKWYNIAMTEQKNTTTGITWKYKGTQPRLYLFSVLAVSINSIALKMLYLAEIIQLL